MAPATGSGDWALEAVADGSAATAVPRLKGIRMVRARTGFDKDSFHHKAIKSLPANDIDLDALVACAWLM
jgi:hypothetical protein